MKIDIALEMLYRDAMVRGEGTKSHLRRLLQEAGVPFELSDHFYRESVLSLNGGKGRHGEFLVTASILGMLRDQGDVENETPPRCQVVIPTPHGSRRIDLYFDESRLGIEVKSGYVRRTRFLRQQVHKDVWLVRNRPDLLAEVMWIFLQGATKPTKTLLEQSGIAWLDMHLST